MSEESQFHLFESFNKDFAFNDDGFLTSSSSEQKFVEDIVQVELERVQNAKNLELIRHLHGEKLLTSLSSVGANYSGLDSSRPWMCYWAVHGLNILGVDIPPAMKSAVTSFLKSCEDPLGGYGGGPGQYAHLATTYAAVMCLVSLKTDEARDSVDLVKLSAFLKRMKQPDGSFTVQEGGEADIRGAYTAVAVAAMCGLLTPELFDQTAEWILRCQTFEGGFGGEENVEAHGGYTYCGVAAMALLAKFNMVETNRLTKWLVHRQMRFEGGFNGRVNKLVDGCYSFWQAGAIVILTEELAKSNNSPVEPGSYLFNPTMLQEYILVACQDRRGGLRDKPDKKTDLYHSCYVLSGLSLAQGQSLDVVGGAGNKVNNICALFNVVSDVPKEAHNYFEKKLFGLTKNE